MSERLYQAIIAIRSVEMLDMRSNIASPAITPASPAAQIQRQGDSMQEPDSLTSHNWSKILSLNGRNAGWFSVVNV